MKLKFILSVSVCFCLFLNSCQYESVELTKIKRSQLAIQEIILYYHSDAVKDASYEVLKGRVKDISKRYNIEFEPMPASKYEALYSPSAKTPGDGGDQGPCAGFCCYLIHSMEWVDEGNGKWGLVVHYGNGYSRLYSYHESENGDLIEDSEECYTLYD